MDRARLECHVPLTWWLMKDMTYAAKIKENLPKFFFSISQQCMPLSDRKAPNFLLFFSWRKHRYITSCSGPSRSKSFNRHLLLIGTCLHLLLHSKAGPTVSNKDPSSIHEPIIYQLIQILKVNKHRENSGSQSMGSKVQWMGHWAAMHYESLDAHRTTPNG